MTPLMNTIDHDPEKGHWGDCHRVVIASLLDLRADEVPHFNDVMRTPDQASELVDVWLRGKGYVQVHQVFRGVELVDVLGTQGVLNPGVYYILGGTSIKGCGHSVIGCGGEIVHDPTGNGIVGPMEDGHYWVTHLLPVTMTKVEGVPGRDLMLMCSECNGDGFSTWGDRHAETRKDVCGTCRGTGTIRAATGESEEASA